MLIKGTDLNAAQRKLVLSTFVHRWTHENARQTYGGTCPGCAQRDQYGKRDGQTSADIMPDGRTWHEYHVPLKTDAEWLAGYAFDFIKDGSRLSASRTHCVSLAEMEAIQG